MRSPHVRSYFCGHAVLCVHAVRLKEGSVEGWAKALQWSTEKNHSFIQQLTPSG